MAHINYIEEIKTQHIAQHLPNKLHLCYKTDGDVGCTFHNRSNKINYNLVFDYEISGKK